MSCHIVTEVVKTELVVGTECDIGAVGLAACLGVGLMLVNAVNRQAVEHIERTHPLGITLGQVVVHGNYMYAVAGQCVKEHRQGSHKCLTLTGCHLGNLTLMQNYTTKQLYVIVDHIPYGVITSGYPMMLPKCLVTIYDHKVMLGCQVTVKIGRGNLNLLILGKTAGCLLYDGEHIGKDIVKNHLIAVHDLLLQFIYLVEQRLAVLQFSLFNLSLKLLKTCPLRYNKIFDFLLYSLSGSTQLVI